MLRFKIIKMVHYNFSENKSRKKTNQYVFPYISENLDGKRKLFNFVQLQTRTIK